MTRSDDDDNATSSADASPEQWLGLWREFGVLGDLAWSDPWGAVSYRFNENGALSWKWENLFAGDSLYRDIQRWRDQFKKLAERAGVARGARPVPNDEPDSWRHFDARDYWLHFVFADQLGVPLGNPPGLINGRSGRVENVCRACADFCSKLQAQTFAAGNAALPPAQPQVAHVESAEPKVTEQASPSRHQAKGFEGLGQKNIDLSRYFDAADLTERQRECASMTFEYSLKAAEIGRRLGIHRSTVKESIEAANKRLKRNANFQEELKKRIAHRGSRAH